MRVAKTEGVKKRLQGKKIENYTADGFQVSGMVGKDNYGFFWTDIEPENDAEAAWIDQNMPAEVKTRLLEAEAAAKREAEKLPEREKESIMHLSMEHIKPKTFEFLLSVCMNSWTDFPFMVFEKCDVERIGRITERTTTGFFIHLLDGKDTDLDAREDIPDDLKEVLHTVITEKVDWLILDSDAPLAGDYEWPAGKNLPVYTW